MDGYTARHARYPHKRTHNNHKHDQPKLKHDVPFALRRLTALTAAAAALIGGGYLGHHLVRKARQLQHSQPLVSWRSMQRTPL